MFTQSKCLNTEEFIWLYIYETGEIPDSTNLGDETKSTVGESSDLLIFQFETFLICLLSLFFMHRNDNVVFYSLLQQGK